jgi:hypothetical protein
MKIFLVNHKVKNCGVYQYGKRVASIISKSKNLIVHYLEMDNREEFQKEVDEHKPQVIVYNHLTGTMPWVDGEYVNQLRQLGIKQGTIVHNVAYSTFFDFYLHQDPNYKPNENNYRLLRPLFQYTNKTNLNPNKLKIGSFGFGFASKQYESLCACIRDNFHRTTFPVELRLHLTHSHFCENSRDIETIKFVSNRILNNPNITLNITTNFISDDELLEFLAGNDLNIFFYQKYPSYNGISSSIDYALSVKRPIAICRSNMFSHIWNTTPSICAEDSSLKEIINNGFGPLEHYYNQWSHSNFIKVFEDNIKNVVL